MVLGVFLSAFAIYLWRLHIYADENIVAYRGGARSFEITRSEIAEMAFSTPLPLHCAFLDVDGRSLLDVPIAAVLPRRRLLQLAEYLQVSVRGIK